MLREQIKALSTEALRNKDAETRKCLGNILTKFLETEKSGEFKGWTEELELEILRAYIKSLQKGIEQMKGSPVAEAYQKEVDLLTTFLPKGPSEEDLKALLEPYAANAKSLGQFIGAVMKDHKGKVAPELVRKFGQDLGLK